MLLPDLCLFILTNELQNSHSLPCVGMFPCCFFPAHLFHPFSTNKNDPGDTTIVIYQKKTQKTGQTDIFRQLQHPTRFLDLSRGYSSRGVLKQQLQTAVESTGSFEML